jgi:hypothetical protein
MGMDTQVERDRRPARQGVVEEVDREVGRDTAVGEPQLLCGIERAEQRQRLPMIDQRTAEVVLDR